MVNLIVPAVVILGIGLLIAVSLTVANFKQTTVVPYRYPHSVDPGVIHPTGHAAHRNIRRRVTFSTKNCSNIILSSTGSSGSSGSSGSISSEIIKNPVKTVTLKNIKIDNIDDIDTVITIAFYFKFQNGVEKDIVFARKTPFIFGHKEYADIGAELSMISFIDFSADDKGVEIHSDIPIVSLKISKMELTPSLLGYNEKVSGEVCM